MDHAASTPVDKKVKKAMDPFFMKYYSNPSGLYKEGRDAKEAVDWARRSVAESLQVREDEVVFTSGGTESNGAVIFGVVNALRKRNVPFEDMHIITTNFEHPSVSVWVEEMEKKGVQTDYLEVGRNGIVDPEALRSLLRPETILVSVMYVNNEIGTIQPIRKCAKVIREFRKDQAAQRKKVKDTGLAYSEDLPYFHTDACQAVLFLDFSSLGVDLITLDGQKIYGPKGVGIVYKRRGVGLEPLVKGGAQQSGYRGGTEPTPLIVGMAVALRKADERKMRDTGRINRLQDYFIKELKKEIEDVEINGDLNWRIPNNVAISIPGLDSEYIIISLDKRGVACSAGAACSLKEAGGGRVNSVRALGKGDIYAQSAIRFSMGRKTSKRDIKYVVKALKDVVDIGKRKDKEEKQ